jgi:hypothetical protein
MPAKIPDQHGLAGMERISQVPPSEEKGIIVSCFPVYFCYKRL